MTRFLLASAVAGVVAAAAPAQFLPVGRQSYNFGYAPAGFGNGVGFNYGGFSFAYYQTRQFSYTYNNPLLGYSGAVNLQFNYYGAVPPFGYGGAAVNPYAQAAYLSGGAGGYYPGANPIVQEQQRLLAGGLANNGRRGNDANRVIADQAQLEFGRRPEAGGAVPPAAQLDPALLDPPDAAVASGDTLNALHAAIRPLMEKRKGEPPVFPAEVLGHLRFDGPAAADVLGWVRTGKLAAPAGPLFDKIRADAEKPAGELLDAAAAGKKGDPAAADRLRFVVTTARTGMTDQLRGLGVSDALAASRFLAALAALADAGRDGTLTSFYPAKWGNGASAAELLGHMDRLKLSFGPAGPGDEDAYAATHRGLVGYYLSLAAKR